MLNFGGVPHPAACARDAFEHAVYLPTTTPTLGVLDELQIRLSKRLTTVRRFACLCFLLGPPRVLNTVNYLLTVLTDLLVVPTQHIAYRCFIRSIARHTQTMLWDESIVSQHVSRKFSLGFGFGRTDGDALMNHCNDDRNTLMTLLL
jgi:hypothetical protein